MSEMKDSNVKWIGKIPYEWSVNRLRYVCDMKTGGTPDDKYGINTDEDGYPWITAQDMNETYKIQEYSQYIDQEAIKKCKYKLFPSKSILLVCIASVGKLGMIKEKAYSNQQITALMPNKMVNEEYLLYFIQSISHKIIADASSSVVPIVNTTYLKDIMCLLPLKDEQKMIADFIDKKVEKIDEILSDLNNEINILNKYKQSLITETVTTGLNTNIEMKDSNIDWIGSIPKNWNCKKIKYIITNDKNGIKVGPFGSSLTDAVVGKDEGEYKIYGQANLIRKDFDFGDNFVIEKDYKRLINYEVLPDDVAVSMMGTIGKCCVVPKNIKKGIMDSHLIKIRLQNNIVPKYFEYQYESSVIYEQLMYFSNGAIMNGLNSTIVKNIYLVIPNKKEQQEIVDYLDKKCEKIEILLRDKQKQIEKMKQYKKSLIYEYVTGKKRVKGAEELYG